MILILSLLFISLTAGVPQWLDLECEDGHKYLFSEITMSWEEARGECALYGGWLVDLRTREEQNCILRGARAAEVIEGWYWHDGN